MNQLDFHAQYDRKSCLDFLKTAFLPEDFIESDEKIDISEKMDFINSITFLGNCHSLDLNVYEIEHQSEQDPRVTLTKNIFRLMRLYSSRRSLVYLVSKNSQNYRFSLVTIDFDLEKNKIKRQFSNPRRYSYLLGPGAKVHTPDQFLILKGRVKDLDDLKNRFSVEVVNKEFYSKIALLFTKLVGGIRKVSQKEVKFPGILLIPSTTNHQMKQEFAVRMIGRIVFCWFLKKKTTSKGIPLIPDEVFSLDAVISNNNYYHSILETLFFQVLNTPQSERKTELISELFKNIPFLNGGLFEPHHDDFYEFDQLSCISKYSNILKVPDSWMKEFFELLETYNFTIDENTTVDVELSVDPEMLGRIFENLLAEINPSTGETARKSTGSFYTPRPIVEYMVDESLRQFLFIKTEIEEKKLSKLLSYNDEDGKLNDNEKEKVLNALDKIKIIDPACGSGAFTMGILQKMVLILQKVDPDSMKWVIKQVERIPDPMVRKTAQDTLIKENWDYIRKLGIIQNSIYGVDLQQIAVEISKLRFFLSLIVDTKIDENEENLGIKYLPNLEFKFVCANSLIGLPEYKGGFVEAKVYIKKLKNLREQYFSCTGETKKKIEYDFKKTQNEMFNHAIEWEIFGEQQTMALSDWDPFSDKPSNWFDSEWMFGIKEGFDIVIANPPYGAELSEKEKSYLKIRFTEYKSAVKNSAIYFTYKSNELLSSSGVNSFIVPKSICYSLGWNECANFIVPSLQKLIDMGKAFENVLLEQVVFIRCLGQTQDKFLNGLYDDYQVKEFQLVDKNVFSKYHVLLAGQTFEEINILIRILSEHTKTWGEYVNIERGLNWQSKVAKNKGSTPIYRGAQLDKYVLNTPTDFVNLDTFSKNEYSYQREIKLLNQLAIAHVMNPYPHFYLQSVLDETGRILVYETISCTFLKDKRISPKFCVGLNNSKLFAWLLYKFVFSNAIRSTRYDKEYVSKLPIPDLLKKDQSPIIKLVDQILTIKRTNPMADTADLENEIDQLVYKMYKLTKDEIRIIEGGER